MSSTNSIHKFFWKDCTVSPFASILLKRNLLNHNIKTLISNFKTNIKVRVGKYNIYFCGDFSLQYINKETNTILKIKEVDDYITIEDVHTTSEVEKRLAETLFEEINNMKAEILRINSNEDERFKLFDSKYINNLEIEYNKELSEKETKDIATNNENIIPNAKKAFNINIITTCPKQDTISYLFSKYFLTQSFKLKNYSNNIITTSLFEFKDIKFNNKIVDLYDFNKIELNKIENISFALKVNNFEYQNTIIRFMNGKAVIEQGVEDDEMIKFLKRFWVEEIFRIVFARYGKKFEVIYD